jgi:large subunit ribosomal protein L9
MKLILKETVERVGKMGEIVNVADGYARNYLLPKGLGLLTTPRNVKEREHLKRVVEDKIKKEKRQVEDAAQKISAMTLTIPVQVGEGGKLFGSVTTRDIADAILAQGIKIDRHNVILEKPIKELGSIYVPVKMGLDITVQIKVEVTPSASVSGAE